MTSLKRPQRDMQVASMQPGPAPSPALLGEFAQRSQAKRDEAATCNTNAAAEGQAAQLAQGDADQMGEQLRALMAEVDRVRKVIADKAEEAAAHRANADRHEKKARELLNDAAWMDEVNARAGRLPAFQPQCSCTLPGAPDAAERAAACPVHSTAGRDGGGPEPVR